MCAFLLPAFGLISAYEIRSGLLGLALPFVCTCGGDERARDGIQPSGKKLQNPLEKPHPAPSAVAASTTGEDPVFASDLI